MAALDMGTLKNYVLARDDSQFDNLGEGLVSLNVSHSNLKQKWPEIRVNLHTTVGAVKERLYNHGGTTVVFQKLQLRDRSGQLIADLNDDSRKIGFYSPQNGMNLHIIDHDPFSLSKNGGLEDVSLVEKYVMPDEKYNQLDNSLRAYKKKMRAKDPHWTFLKENRREPRVEDPENFYGADLVVGMEVGDRCEVFPGGRRGEVMWIGEGTGKKDELQKGYWVGVKLDEPLGKNDGSKGNLRLFECPPGYGSFVRPNNVKTGDYPEKGIEEEDSSSDEEFVP